MDGRKNSEARAAVAAFATKRVDFRFRSRQLSLALSHALFSSADVDTGTRFLLRVLSRLWDEDIAAGKALPKTVLDAGCGVGVIGIAAAAALMAEGVRDLRVRAQDRDELAAEFTAENAAANGIGPEILASYAEPLLAGPEGARWDLMLSNVPAKAGAAVLADFFARSVSQLAAGGRAMAVVVNPLADAARAWIADAGALITTEDDSPEHTVFAYGRSESEPSPQLLSAGPVNHLAPAAGDPVSLPSPVYVRTEGDFIMEETPYRIQAIHGVADFDEPGRSVVMAAKLLAKLEASASASHTAAFGPSVLVHECDQGHFPAWLAARAAASSAPRFTLVARNVLALAAARKNTQAAKTAAAADLGIAADRLLAENGPFDLVVSFPEAVPRVDRIDASWSAAAKLLEAEGLFIVSQTSTEAERFDRAKPRGFSRAGDLKRDGFRALAYRKNAD